MDSRSARQVFEEDLLLQVFRAGRDEHALAAQDRGDQVGERLARAGAGFGQQRAAVVDDRRHGGSHAALPFARLEPRHRARDRARVRERGVYESAEIQSLILAIIDL